MLLPKLQHATTNTTYARRKTYFILAYRAAKKCQNEKSVYERMYAKENNYDSVRNKNHFTAFLNFSVLQMYIIVISLYPED